MANGNGLFERRVSPEVRVIAEGRTQSYRERNTPTRIEQAWLLEKLRYRSYPARSLQQRIMQRLGDFGRSIAPWLARGGWR